MALASLYGGFLAPVGPGFNSTLTAPAVISTIIDAANEAVIFLGRIATSDGGSHTVDTSGSSSIGWRSSTLTFSDGGTTVKVGIAAVLTTAGPAGRAANASDVITFDVSTSLTGGGAGITANAWQSHVPDTGTKTIAHGDLVAFAIQMTARGGSDAVNPSYISTAATMHQPSVTSYVGAAYGATSGAPNAIITFSDGALGFFYGGEVFSVQSQRGFSSGDATKEFGQLYSLPFPTKIYGLYGWVDPDADFDVVLYSDPLGTPVAEKTISVDANTVASAAGRRFTVLFSSPYNAKANEKVGAVFKPGGSNIIVYYKTLSGATHRVADVWGANGYGISRASGAFSDANSSLDHYYIGLLCGGFEHGVWPAYGMGI